MCRKGLLIAYLRGIKRVCRVITCSVKNSPPLTATPDDVSEALCNTNLWVKKDKECIKIWVGVGVELVII